MELQPGTKFKDNYLSGYRRDAILKRYKLAKFIHSDDCLTLHKVTEFFTREGPHTTVTASTLQLLLNRCRNSELDISEILPVFLENLEPGRFVIDADLIEAVARFGSEARSLSQQPYEENSSERGHEIENALEAHHGKREQRERIMKQLIDRAEDKSISITAELLIPVITEYERPCVVVEMLLGKAKYPIEFTPQLVQVTTRYGCFLEKGKTVLSLILETFEDNSFYFSESILSNILDLKRSPRSVLPGEIILNETNESDTLLAPSFPSAGARTTNIYGCLPRHKKNVGLGPVNSLVKGMKHKSQHRDVDTQQLETLAFEIINHRIGVQLSAVFKAEVETLLRKAKNDSIQITARVLDLALQYRPENSILVLLLQKAKDKSAHFQHEPYDILSFLTRIDDDSLEMTLGIFEWFLDCDTEVAELLERKIKGKSINATEMVFVPWAEATAFETKKVNFFRNKENEKEGLLMRTQLLMSKVVLTDDAITDILALNNSGVFWSSLVLGSFLNEVPSNAVTITERSVMNAARHHNSHSTTMILANRLRKESVKITDELVLDAVRLLDDKKDVWALLLKKRKVDEKSPEMRISVEFFNSLNSMWKEGSYHVLELLQEYMDLDISESAMAWVLADPSVHPDLHNFVRKTLCIGALSRIAIKDKVSPSPQPPVCQLKETAELYHTPNKLSPSQYVELHKRLIVIIFGCQSVIEIEEFFTENNDYEFSITKALIKVIVENEICGEEVLRALLTKPRHHGTMINASLLEDVAFLEIAWSEVLATEKTTSTEEIMSRLNEELKRRERLAKMLIESAPEHSIEITPELVVSLMDRCLFPQRPAVMGALLAKAKQPVEITAQLIEATVRFDHCYESSKEILGLLLAAAKDDGIIVTEAVIVALLSGPLWGRSSFATETEVLLSKAKEDSICLISRMLDLASQQAQNDKLLILLLRKTKGKSIELTDSTITAISRSKAFCQDVHQIEFFFTRTKKDKLEVTEEALRWVSKCNNEVARLLISKINGDSVQILQKLPSAPISNANQCNFFSFRITDDLPSIAQSLALSWKATERSPEYSTTHCKIDTWEEPPSVPIRQEQPESTMSAESSELERPLRAPEEADRKDWGHDIYNNSRILLKSRYWIMKYAPTLLPIQEQLQIDHNPFIDLIPFPYLRQSLLQAIKNRTISSEEEFEICHDIQRGGIVMREGPSYEFRSYEVTQEFVQKWGELIPFSYDIVDASNFWRFQRRERRLQVPQVQRRMLGQERGNFQERATSPITHLQEATAPDVVRNDASEPSHQESDQEIKRLSQEHNISHQDRIKLWIERTFDVPISWWPLNPPCPIRSVELSWRCTCGSKLSELLPTELLQGRIELLQGLGYTVSGAHPLTAHQGSGSGRQNSQNAQTPSTSTASQGSNTANTQQLSAQTNIGRRRPYLYLQNWLGNAQVNPPTTNLPKSKDYIIVYIDRGHDTPRCILLPSKKDRCDSEFFKELRKEYYNCYNLKSRWLTLSCLHEFKFVKLERFNKYIHCYDRELPLTQDTNYEYRLQTPPIPPVPNPVMLHHFNSPEAAGHQARKIIDLIPKRVDGPLPNEEELAWGLQAVKGLSVFRVLVLISIVISLSVVVGTVLFFWWLSKHAGDLQDAAVPMTIILSIVSLVVGVVLVVQPLRDKAREKGVL